MESSNNFCQVRTSISPISLHSEISIFPNPTNNFINIDLKEISKDIVLTINDISGQIMLSRVFSNQRYIQFSLKSFSDGIYFIKVKADDKEAFIKVIKQE